MAAIPPTTPADETEDIESHDDNLRMVAYCRRLHPYGLRCLEWGLPGQRTLLLAEENCDYSNFLWDGQLNSANRDTHCGTYQQQPEQR